MGNTNNGGSKEVVYRRRSRLLDDAFLEDEKNNIPGNIPINLESSQSSQNNDSVIHSVESNQNSIPSSSKNDKFIETQNKDNSINHDIIKKDADSIKNRCFDLTHNDNELNENIMYRKQKFVAEWLQNSSNIPKSSPPKSTTSTNVLDVDAAIKNNIKELDYENNNSTEASFSSSSVQLKQNTSSESISNAQESYVDKLKMDKILLTNSGSDYDGDSMQKDSSSNVDLVQMEYNVRKFLLKQHEWSMTSVFQSDFNDLYSDDEEPIFVRRTETNL